MTIENLYRIFLEHPVLYTDSREVQPGGLYFALKGQNFNGNEFAGECLEKGCFRVIVDEAKYKTNERCILVEDALKALQQLANASRAVADLAEFLQRNPDALVVGRKPPKEQP